MSETRGAASSVVRAQTSKKIGSLVDFFLDQPGGGRLSILRDPEEAESYMVAIEFGEEEPGSEMRAGAAYGTGSDLDSALDQVLDRIGLSGS